MNSFFPLEQLSIKDRKIMYELDCNSRQSNAVIAKKINLNKNVVNYHIKKLEEKKIIESYYSIIDTTKLGYSSFRVYLKWRSVTPEKRDEIIDFVTKSNITWWVGSLEGNWNLGFMVWVKNIYEFQQFWRELEDRYHQFIASSVVSIYTKIYDCSYAFISPERRAEKKVFIVGKPGNETLTKIQTKLLEILSRNARMPIIEIADRLNVSPLTVSNNIKELKEKNILLGFRTKFNLEALGYTHYKINFNLKDFTRYNDMLAYAKAHPNIIYIDESIGFANFEIEIAVPSHKKFQETMEEINALFGEEIIDYNYFIYSTIHKIKYFKE